MIKNKKNIKSRLIIPVVAVLSLTIMAVFFMQNRSNKTTSDQAQISQTEAVDQGQQPTPAPATQQESAEAEEHKEKIGSDSPDEAILGQPVTPVISFADKRGDIVEVRSFVPNIYEDGGECTITFTKGNETLSVQSDAVKDVSYTRCEPASLPVNEFSSGSWEAKVEYTSSTSIGESETREIIL